MKKAFAAVFLILCFISCKKNNGPESIKKFGAGYEFINQQGEINVYDNPIDAENRSTSRDDLRIEDGVKCRILFYDEKHRCFYIEARDKKRTKGYINDFSVSYGIDFIPRLKVLVDNSDSNFLAILEKIEFTKISEVNDSLLDLVNSPGFENIYDKFDFFPIVSKKIKDNDVENLGDSDYLFLKIIDYEIYKYSDYFLEEKVYNMRFGKNKETPLIYAVKNGQPEFFETCLYKNCDFYIKDKFGKTVFDYARENAGKQIDTEEYSEKQAYYKKIVEAAAVKETEKEKAVEETFSLDLEDYREIVENWTNYCDTSKFSISINKDYKFKFDKVLNCVYDTQEINDKFNKAVSELYNLGQLKAISTKELFPKRCCYAIGADNLITNQKEKIPLFPGERLFVIKKFDQVYTFKMNEIDVTVPFYLVQMESGKIGVMDGFSLAHKGEKYFDMMECCLFPVIFSGTFENGKRDFLGKLIFMRDNKDEREIKEFKLNELITFDEAKINGSLDDSFDFIAYFGKFIDLITSFSYDDGEKDERTRLGISTYYRLNENDELEAIGIIKTMVGTEKIEDYDHWVYKLSPYWLGTWIPGIQYIKWDKYNNEEISEIEYWKFSENFSSLLEHKIISSKDVYRFEQEEFWPWWRKYKEENEKRYKDD
ncbi:MAG: ankyrin repeat domain-containing protein [Treponema sp.]|nr:ankyrin repeat domain-containing protein [Treponema sp.]